MAVHENTECIKLQTDFYTIIDSQNTLIDHIFPDVHTQYKNHKWLTERAILAAKKCGHQWVKFKDTTVIASGLDVIQIYRCCLRYQRNCELSN